MSSVRWSEQTGGSHRRYATPQVDCGGFFEFELDRRHHTKIVWQKRVGRTHNLCSTCRCVEGLLGPSSQGDRSCCRSPARRRGLRREAATDSESASSCRRRLERICRSSRALALGSMPMTMRGRRGPSFAQPALEASGLQRGWRIQVRRGTSRLCFPYSQTTAVRSRDAQARQRVPCVRA